MKKASTNMLLCLAKCASSLPLPTHRTCRRIYICHASQHSTCIREQKRPHTITSDLQSFGPSFMQYDMHQETRGRQDAAGSIVLGPALCSYTKAYARILLGSGVRIDLFDRRCTGLRVFIPCPVFLRIFECSLRMQDTKMLRMLKRRRDKGVQRPELFLTLTEVNGISVHRRRRWLPMIIDYDC